MDRWRKQGCVEIFRVIFFRLPGASSGARSPEHSSSCRVQMSCEVGSRRQKPAEREGETFHLVKFLPWYVFQPPSPQGREGDSVLRQ